MRSMLLILSLLLLCACQSPEPRMPLSQTSGHFLKKSITRNKKLVARQEKRILAIIKKDGAHTYFSSSHGFWYRYDKRNTQDTLTPTYGDKVIFRYDISSLSGQTIYSMEDIGLRVNVIDREDIFSGMRLALKLMKQGEKATFYFPSYQAFGYTGDTKEIGRNEPIKTSIILDSIIVDHDTRKQPFKQ